ncbi:MAG: sigma-E processing peptidase SpoIIGA [Lachnospiraceae bacterium]|nr:sigma-E processing peptidase SpoIIGA [Lachnospiraceae bacterium]
MNYIVYADVMFFWNFFINICTLLISQRLLHTRINLKRILLWSFITGALTDVVYIIFYDNILLPIFYALCYIFMTYMFFKTETVRELLQKNMAVLSSMLFIYGIINIFKGGEQLSLAHILISLMTGTLLFCFTASLISHKLSGKYYKLILCLSGKKIYATGYKDTGNTLEDPYTHKPVMILDYRIMKKLTSEDAYTIIINYQKTGYMDYAAFKNISCISLHPVPYQTVSSSCVFMPVFIMDYMVLTDEKKAYKKMAFGISRYKLNNDFQVLLNENM